MQAFSFRFLSLRSRFLGAIAAVFILLVAVALGSALFMHRAVDVLDRVVEQSVYKLRTTSQLQNQIRKAFGSIENATGARRSRLRQQFDAESRSVDDLFAGLLNQAFLEPEERARLADTRREWRDSVELAKKVFTSGAPNAVSNALDRRYNRIMLTLDRLSGSYYDGIDAQRARFSAAENRFLLMIALTIGIGLVGALLAAAWLTRSVLMPLREIEKGMTHFANDKLSYRLDLNHNNEIGHLAREFNAMAEHLMEHRLKLEEMSIRDGLTGLFNRRELDRRLNEETQRARRYQRPYAVLMLDIDRFKDVNDRYGHPTGDEVLVTVADLVLLNVRPVDAVFRYGGEELAAILPETDDSGARIVAERIRRTIEDSLTATPQGDTVSVTVSIGIATFPRDGDTGAKLIHAADRALYAAKMAGRNIVRSAST